MTSPTTENAARDICQERSLTFDGYVSSGAFKDTYRVVDELGRAHALKVYKPGFSAERTQREIDAMQRCSHPAIAKLTTALGRIDHRGEAHFYSIEEFVSGGTLTARLSRGGLLSVDETIRLGTRLIAGVAHIASQSLVHRDLKPDNIMFRESGDAVIVDFGIVRDLQDSSLTATWANMGPGTPFFSAPEQLRNEKSMIDWRTDQFALGVVLALCCIGRHPYELTAGNDVETVTRVANRERPADSFAANAVDIGFGLLLKMAAPWPIGRYRTPADLSAAWPRES